MKKATWRLGLDSVARRLSPWLAMVALGVVPGASSAQDVDTLRLRDVIQAVREGNPRLRAARLSADAAREMVAPAGALPDPQVMIGLMNRPLDLGADQMMTMNVVHVQQTIPWPGIQANSRDRMDRLAESSSLTADELEHQLVARAIELYYRAAFAERAVGVMERTRQLLESFAEVATRRYEVGAAVQQDVLQSQVAVAQMTEAIVLMGQHGEATVARLNALMAVPAARTHPPFDLPFPIDSLAPVDSLVALATASRPALRAAALRIEAASAGVAAARRDRYPDFTVGLGYSQRPNYPDLVSLSLGVTVPLWTASRQAPMQREQEARRAMAEAEANDLFNETYAQMVELRSEAASTARLIELYQSSVLPQADAASEAALSAYRVGSVDYMTLVESQMAVNRYEVEMHRLAASYQAATAKIRALTGGEPGGSI